MHDNVGRRRSEESKDEGTAKAPCKLVNGYNVFWLPLFLRQPKWHVTKWRIFISLRLSFFSIAAYADVENLLKPSTCNITDDDVSINFQ
jgi:hypothetical protein